MPKSHRPYPAEFRAEAIRLVRQGGQPVVEIARRLEVTTETLRLWVRQAAIDEGLRHDGLTTHETEEMRQLRREVRQLREEREILVKAAAFFAKEMGHTRP
jgi:transposase